MGLNFLLPFLIIGNCAQLQKHYPLSLFLFDDEVIFHCIIYSLQVYLKMPWHFSRKSGCYHFGHSYPMQKSGTAAREGLGGLQPPSVPPPPPPTFWMVNKIFYSILLNSPYPLLTKTTYITHYLVY